MGRGDRNHPIGSSQLTVCPGDRYHLPVKALVLALLVCPLSAFGQQRQLVDEVVAVVDAHSITLSELVAETRVRLAAEEGAQAAFAPLDRRILAASLRNTVEERVVLSEIERLKLFDLDRAEVQALVARLRSRFGSDAEYEAFTRQIELTD